MLSDCDSEEETLMATILMGYSVVFKNKRKKKRYIWAKRYLQRRKTQGLCVGLLQELRTEYSQHSDYKRFLRIDPTTFDELLGLIRSRIEKENTKFRDSISAEDRLAITLRYLATGTRKF